MNIKELLKDRWKKQERITFIAPLGTKSEIVKRVGRQGVSKLCRESIYKKLSGE